MSSGPGGVDRRSVLAVLGGLAACRGAYPGTLGSPPVKPFADAHLHLFNAADLPVEGFLRYVSIPNLVGAPVPGWGAALLHLFATLYKPSALTAREERGRLRARASAGWSEAEFAARTAEAIERNVGRGVADTVATPGGLRASYRSLDETLLQASAVPVSRNPDLAAAERRRVLADIAAAAERIGDVAGDDPAAASGMGALGAGALFRLLGWAHLMVQSRERHLLTYLKRFTAPGHSARLLTNHLVDYDYWVDDAPAVGSSQQEQVACWRELARRAASLSWPVGIRTFLGYCPLRHAIEIEEGRPTTFAWIRQAVAAGEVAGIKLYPPMGFQPWGNTDLRDGQFAAGPPGRRNALVRWKAAGGQARLGLALDGALSQFYQWAADSQVPLMAHGGPGNAAGPGYGERANPKYWEEALKRFPLRLSIGHVINKVEDFINAREPYPADVWALQATRRLLDPTNNFAVWGDIAYSPELIDNGPLAESFFRRIAAVFGSADPGLTRFLFGTDWVMLGREAHDSRFLAAVIKGMEAAEYTAEQVDNMLYRNAERFLGRA